MNCDRSCRIQDLKDRRLYLFLGQEAPAILEPLLGGYVDRDHMAAHWDEVLRLGTSIRSGTVTAFYRASGPNLLVAAIILWNKCGTSTVVPAVANAILATTGKRPRKMPVDTEALKQPI